MTKEEILDAIREIKDPEGLSSIASFAMARLCVIEESFGIKVDSVLSNDNKGFLKTHTQFSMEQIKSEGGES